ncbi:MULTISPECIES: Mo-dependent nitrogenase C-terminal domain-containing protein [unclassified Microcoleus]
MSKLNPVYEELIGLSFRSLSFLGGVSQNRYKFPTIAKLKCQIVR